MMLEYAPMWIAFDMLATPCYPGFLADLLPMRKCGHVPLSLAVLALVDITFVTQPRTPARRYAVIGALSLLEAATTPMNGPIDFDDGTRWELGDSFAGGANKRSQRIDGELVPGFITLKIIPAHGPDQEYRYYLGTPQPDAVVSDGPTP